MKLCLSAMAFVVLSVFVSMSAFSAEEVNIPNFLLQEGIIEEQSQSEEYISSCDINGSPNLPYKLYDGDMDTKWCTESEEISWIKIDFMEPRLVSKFVVYMAGNCARDAGKWNYNLADFQIQSSMTGEEDSWEDEVVVEENLPDEEHGILTFEITPKAMRWVRLYITDQGGDQHARVPEFQVWGLLTAAVSPRDKLATTWASVKHGN
jgi:hypothetical protein